MAATSSAPAQLGELEFYNGFDPAKPTIIATHGWLGTVTYEDTFGRSPSFAERANLIGWEWDAVVFVNLVGRARRSGRELATEYRSFILDSHPNYDGLIQIAGHSLGTHVATEAVLTLRDLGMTDPDALAYQANQLTLVDGGPEPGLLQPRLDDLNDSQIELLKIDNYFSPPGAFGIGEPYFGVANTRIPVDHSAIWDWYFESLDSAPIPPIQPGAAYGVVGPYSELDIAPAFAWLISGAGTPIDPSDDRFRYRLW